MASEETLTFERAFVRKAVTRTLRREADKMINGLKMEAKANICVRCGGPTICVEGRCIVCGEQPWCCDKCSKEIEAIRKQRETWHIVRAHADSGRCDLDDCSMCRASIALPDEPVELWTLRG